MLARLDAEYILPLRWTADDALVIADDDVRYAYDALASVVDDLNTADLVKPQNHFDPFPWHAGWDTARALINRGVSSDYPGTYGLRRSIIVAAGGYDADVLFENLELERTVVAAGGTVSTRRDVFVPRRPPSVTHFLSQRVRQAYDSFAQPGRMLIEASIIPAVICLRRRPRALVALMVILIAVAERGRRRDGGRSVFPPSSVLWVPLWVLERGAATWVAVFFRLRGGVQYAGDRITRAANSTRGLRRRFATAG